MFGCWSIWFTLRCPLATASIVIAVMNGLDVLNDHAGRPIPSARRDMGVAWTYRNRRT
jgi:hypothetical protein